MRRATDRVGTPKRMIDVIARRHAELEASPDAAASARRRAGDAMRALIQAQVGADVTEDEYRSFATVIRALAKRWAAHPRSVPAADAATAFTAMADFPDRSPLVGPSNPIAPPMRLEPDLARGEVRGEVTFGRAYEGAPGCVHGGFLAAALDEALGLACIFSGSPGMTGELTIQYRSPTPTGERLEIRARLDRHEGRRIYTTGEIRAGERLTCRAEGLFIGIGAEKFDALQRERNGTR
ncbi:MAG: PaaI family thioesterase [Myxococcales bacterium]|nr:PaaI family thioesterase [Myxococcales bacterium]